MKPTLPASKHVPCSTKAYARVPCPEYRARNHRLCVIGDHRFRDVSTWEYGWLLTVRCFEESFRPLILELSITCTLCLLHALLEAD